MIIISLIILGLVFGSFINALVWRLHEQTVSNNRELSILHGRSMCPHCHHQLAVRDLIPVFSWLRLRGRCRYCHESIAKQYPTIELLTATLFVISYILWPITLSSSWQDLYFATWLIITIGLISLAIYDIKWMIIPNKIIYPLMMIAGISLVLQFMLGRPIDEISSALLSIIIGGGIFWIFYRLSNGQWIGGGDVRLGFLLGMIIIKPALVIFLLFLASMLGIIWILPLLILHKINLTSKIPFGPFLIVASLLVILFGSLAINWYQGLLIFK